MDQFDAAVDLIEARICTAPLAGNTAARSPVPARGTSRPSPGTLRPLYSARQIKRNELGSSRVTPGAGPAREGSSGSDDPPQSKDQGGAGGNDGEDADQVEVGSGEEEGAPWLFS